MPSTPTTKSQVQAYKFVLRRMQSALVRRDAVMLHDPMRTHTRATIVGICLGAVGLVGFLIWGVLSPAPPLPTDDGIVISKESGTVYVLLHSPTKQLIPTFNLASARLLLLAQQSQGQNQSGQKPAAAPNQDPVQPTVVSDKELLDVPKGRLMGIQDGPQLLPNADQRISDDWAVCDAYVLNSRLPAPDSERKVETTVLAGVHDLGQPLAEGKALLVEADDGAHYLIYHLTSSPNVPNTDTVRARVDLSRPEVRTALNLGDVYTNPRKITTALRNSIPEVRPLDPPKIAGAGSPSKLVRDFAVGQVFKVERAGEVVNYYVVEQDGVQEIKQTTADLIRFSGTVPGGSTTIPSVNPEEVSNAPKASKALINEDDVPATVPTVLTQRSFPVACLGWYLAPGASEGHTTVYVNPPPAVPGDDSNNGVPLPKGLGSTFKGVLVTTPSADKLKINYFYLPPGRAAVVRGSTSPADYQTGPIYLVSDRGVKFGIPDRETAAALGVGTQRPAPASIVRLLPDGASLNTRAVLQSYDSVPVGAGVYLTTTSAPPGAAQQGGQSPQPSQPGG